MSVVLLKVKRVVAAFVKGGFVKMASIFSSNLDAENQYLLKVAMYFRLLPWYHKGALNLRKEGTNTTWH